MSRVLFLLLAMIGLVAFFAFGRDLYTGDLSREMATRIQVVGFLALIVGLGIGLREDHPAQRKGENS